MVAPWSGFWERNRFTDRRPALEELVESPYARGAVTGIGVITALAGLVELGGIFAGRARRERSAETEHTPSSGTSA